MELMARDGSLPPLEFQLADLSRHRYDETTGSADHDRSRRAADLGDDGSGSSLMTPKAHETDCGEPLRACRQRGGDRASAGIDLRARPVAR